MRESIRLWQVEWCCPFNLGELTVDVGEFDAAAPFIRDNYGSIFASQASRFLAEAMSPAKLAFASSMDAFVVRDGGQVVGVMLGHPLDWSSYYVRSVAVLPTHRGRGVVGALFAHTYAPLRAAGVERIEIDCSPSNLAMMRVLTRLGWMVTATLQSERWGLQVHATKFLRDEAESIFLRQFCAMRSEPRPAIAPASRSSTEGGAS